MSAFLADAYLHTIDPIAVPITRDFGIRWYGLSYAAGFLIAWLLVVWMAKTRRTLLEPKAVGDLMLYCIIGVLLGGRLGYVIFYDPSLIIDFSSRLPWWGVLAINRGGMASHGGMLGVLISIALFARRYNVPALHIWDVGALASAPGLFLGRLANFINGELLGRPIANQVSPPWWSVKFPQELGQMDPQQLEKLRPVAEYARISPGDWSAAVAEFKALGTNASQQTLDLLTIGVERLIVAAQSGEHAVIEHLRPTLTALYPSQLMQAMTDGPLLFGALVLLWLKPRKPGMIAGAYLIIYGAFRIITELFRRPDAPMWLGLTRGQSLSGLMIVAGIALLWWSQHQQTAPIGGLLKPR